MKKYFTLLLAAIALTQVSEVSAVQIFHCPPANASAYERQMINNYNAQQEQMEIQRQQLQLQRQQVETQQQMLRYQRLGW